MQLEDYSIGDKGATLTACLHSPDDRVRPAVLVFPGGAYRFCSPRENGPVTSRFFDYGYNVFALCYSVGENARDLQPLAEAAMAMLLLRKNAAEWRLDPKRIAVCGFSAGGHLAGSLGLLCHTPRLLERLGATAGQIRPDAMVLCYPVVSSGEYAHRESFFNVTGQQQGGSLWDGLSLEKHVTPEAPPTFIWHTADDATVPVENAIMLAAALQQNKVPWEAHIFYKGGHGLSTCNDEAGTPNPHCAHWLPLCAEWLADVFGNSCK